MQRLFRLLSSVALVAGFWSFASAQPPAGTSFSWNEYVGTDGKKYVHPSWTDVTGDEKKFIFGVGEGTLVVGPNYTATKAKMRLEVPGPLPGSWVLSFEKNPAVIGAKSVLNTHVLSGSDPSDPKKVYEKGSPVRITWNVTLKDANNKEIETTFGPYSENATNKGIAGGDQ